MKGLAAVIRSVRRDLGDSQFAFAVRVGASLSTVQRWEAGDVAPTHYVHVVALERLGVPVCAMQAAWSSEAAA